MQTLRVKVADIPFEINMPNGCPMLDKLQSYDLFINDNENEEPTFTVTIKGDIEVSNLTPLYVEQELIEKEAVVNMYKTDRGTYVTIGFDTLDDVIGKFVANSDNSAFDLAIDFDDFRYVNVFYIAMMLCYTLATTKLNTQIMHATAVINNGKVYMFHAPSGTGKSTHSRLWQVNIPNTKALNDDHPIVRTFSDGKVIVYGSPWSGKTPVYLNESAPLGAIVRIIQAPHNEICQLSKIEAFGSVLMSCNNMVGQDDIMGHTYDTIGNIIATVPCYQLECLPNADAAQLCFNTIAK